MKFTSKFLSYNLFFLLVTINYSFGQFNQSNYNNAFKKAKSEEKVILLFVTAEWCGPCKYVKKLFKEDKDIRKLIEDKYVLISCDFDTKEGKKLKRRFSKFENGIPKLIVINSQEKYIASFYKEMKKIPGDSYRDKFYAFLVKYKQT